MLDTAYTNYTNVNNGYDDMLGYYVKYMMKLVPTILSDDFIFNISTTTQWETMLNLGYGMNCTSTFLLPPSRLRTDASTDFNCKLGNGTQILCSELNSTDDNLTIAEKTTALTLSGSDSYEGTLATASLSPNWVTFGDYEKDVLFVTPHVS